MKLARRMKKGVNWPVSPPMGRQKIMIRLTTKAKTKHLRHRKKIRSKCLTSFSLCFQ
jgi:hypothetical protein